MSTLPGIDEATGTVSIEWSKGKAMNFTTTTTHWISFSSVTSTGGASVPAQEASYNPDP
jgi:hypothetical protein